MSGRIQPPVNTAVTTGGDRVSTEWAGYFQRNADAMQAAADNVGDYKIALNDPGAGWLLCNGGDGSTPSNPQLSAALLPILGPGSAPSTFKLPNLAATMSGSATVGYTYIRGG